MEVPASWRSTKYAGEWEKQSERGICIVRAAPRPHVRCFGPHGGNPADVYGDTVESCFVLGDAFLQGLEVGPS